MERATPKQAGPKQAGPNQAGSNRTDLNRTDLNRSDYDAVLFDVGGVLALPDATVLGPALAPFGGSTLLEVHRRAHYAAMKAKSDRDHVEGQWDAYNHEYLRRVGVRDRDMDLAMAVFEDIRSPHIWRQPIADSVVAMRRLHDEGVPMGVISNAAGQVETYLGWLGVCQVGPGDGVPVRTIIDSHVVGVIKPDPEIFELALDHFREFDRPRILYVGDSASIDIVGATAVGMRAVLMDPYDDHHGERFPRVQSLVDLV